LQRGRGREGYADALEASFEVVAWCLHVSECSAGL
jgi:hypothetical protein